MLISEAVGDRQQNIVCRNNFPNCSQSLSRLIAREAEGITLLSNYIATYRKTCTKSLHTTIIKPSATKNNYVCIPLMAEHARNKLHCQNP